MTPGNSRVGTSCPIIKMVTKILRERFTEYGKLEVPFHSASDGRLAGVNKTKLEGLPGISRGFTALAQN